MLIGCWYVVRSEISKEFNNEWNFLVHNFCHGFLISGAAINLQVHDWQTDTPLTSHYRKSPDFSLVSELAMYLLKRLDTTVSSFISFDCLARHSLTWATRNQSTDRAVVVPNHCRQLCVAIPAGQIPGMPQPMSGVFPGMFPFGGAQVCVASLHVQGWAVWLWPRSQKILWLWLSEILPLCPVMNSDSSFNCTVWWSWWYASASNDPTGVVWFSLY